MAARKSRSRRSDWPRLRRRPSKSGSVSPHAEWLSLVEISGPFLSLPVLERAFPQGLDHDETEDVPDLRLAWEEWLEAQEQGEDRAVHRAWVRWVLERTLELPEEVLRERPNLPPGCEVLIEEHHVTLCPDFVVLNPKGDSEEDRPRLLVSVVPPGQDLSGPLPGERWKASPLTRMTELCRGADEQGVRLGLLTNGEQWMLVHAPRGETAGFCTWQADLWLEERLTLRAFRSLLRAERFFGDPARTLEALLAQSAQGQHEVTNQLGLQVRRSVELLVSAIDRIDRERKGRLLSRVSEPELYRAAVTTMMRLVFLLYAEEQDLLPLSDPFYEANYAASTLLDRLREEADRLGEEVLERRQAAWSRLLATFRAVHAGVEHERMRLPAYGGDLFDPDRFPFLEGRPARTKWTESPPRATRPLGIDDRTVLHLLTSLQYLGRQGTDGGGAEVVRLSFKGLGVEQIGHVYEGLLDHTAVRATEIVLGLSGANGLEPELSVSTLEGARRNGYEALLRLLKEKTGRSMPSLEKALATQIPTSDLPLWRASCQNDLTMLERVRPWAGLVRRGPGGEPIVIPETAVYVTSGTDRRSTGTYYTPPSLTEPIVKHTLDPLLYDGPTEGAPGERWVLRSPEQVLSVRVCDMAMGSAAFLVQACRYLSERLVEAWDALEGANPGKILVAPEGTLSKGNRSESLVPVEPTERLAAARRYVADRCLYGVDKDPMAVEMGKLSLWLVTLQKGKAFSFLDHALKCGDSLFGVSRADQLESFDMCTKPLRQVLLSSRAVGDALATAKKARERLESFTVNDSRDSDAKARLLEEADRALQVLDLAGDLLAGAAVADIEKRGAYEGQRLELGDSLSRLLSEPLDSPERDRQFEQLSSKARKLLSLSIDFDRGERKPFHWPLAFPEVFQKGGFDAFIGNPPFIAGTSISTHLGVGYNRLLKAQYAEIEGRADLCVIFMRRAASLLRQGGVAGLLGSDTTSEGDSRISGPAFLLRNRFSIFRAVKRQIWPGAAAVRVCQCYLFSGHWRGRFVLDGREVEGINSSFDEGDELPEPFALQASKKISFTGTKVYGSGFVLEPEEAERVISANPKNREVVRPYLIGRELNSVRREPGRFIIDFTDMPEERAREYEIPWRIVEERVREERQKAPEKRMRERWWEFQRPRQDLYALLRQRGSAWLIAATSDTVAFVEVPYSTKDPVVFSHALAVLALNGYGDFAVVQSGVHLTWALKFGSSMKGDMRYTTTDCFENFPFPEDCAPLQAIGKDFYEERDEVARSREVGLTSLYHAFHDPEERSAALIGLRDSQVRMDRAVVEAYGWKELLLDHGFQETARGMRFAIARAAQRQIRERLVKLNHERHAEELVDARRGRRPTGRKGFERTVSMFELGDD